MDENMKNVEVTTEETGVENDVKLIDLPAEPSKGFVVGAIGVITAAVVGGVMLFKRHKKKKASRQEVEILDDDDFDEDVIDEPETKPDKKK